jgi:hypothetical protein
MNGLFGIMKMGSTNTTFAYLILAGLTGLALSRIKPKGEK